MPNSTYDIEVKQLRETARRLKAGDRVFLTGEIYTARDAAHKEFMRILDGGGELPFDPRDAVIYYAGPTPAQKGYAVGACGPTTSSRMDAFAPVMYRQGIVATIGKGQRSDDVKDAIRETGGVYLCAVGGAGALISKHITGAEEIAFPELGCESVKKLTVYRLPLTVGVDCSGGDIFSR